jgi:structural maintenance of chromosome 3 (chondroitin sulfate proteoglycan 6)
LIVEKQITQKERELTKLIPQWESQRAKESAEKRKAQEASMQLGALFAKQGRVNRFESKAERDAFLKNEVASVGSYQTIRTAALEATRAELGAAHKSLEEVEERIAGVHGSIDDGRKRVKELAEQLVELKDEQSDLLERRKELWREDTKLSSLVSHATEEKRSAENNLASMMDKVCLFFFLDIMFIEPNFVGHGHGSTCR